MQIEVIMEQSKKREERLHQTAKVGMPDATLPASLRDIAFQDSCSLCSSSWIKGKKVVLYYHPEAIRRQHDPMTELQM